MATLYSIRQDSSDLADDFEVVSSLTGSDESSLCATNQPEIGLSHQNGNNYEIEENRSNDLPAVDPRETFVLIQREHEELKKELEGQQSLLTTGIKSLRDTEAKRNQEMSEMTQKITELRSELEVSKTENELLKSQMKDFKECSEKVDELTAKLFQAEEVAKYHDQVIKQFQSEGFVNVQPPMLTDHLLAKEMTEKENQLKQMRDRLSELESLVIMERERSEKAEKDNIDLRGLVTVVQEQRVEDVEYLSQIRNTYEDQLTCLHREIKRLGGVSTATQRAEQPRSYLPPEDFNDFSSPPPEPSIIDNLMQRSTSEERLAVDGGDKVFQCDICRIRVCDANLFHRHVNNCRRQANIDEID